MGMRSKSTIVLLSIGLVLAACGVPAGESPDGVGEDEPLLQILSEGGFAPVEVILNVAPRYTLLGDGRLIHPGFQTLEYPGRLVPPYLVAQLDDTQVDEILDLVERMGLEDIDDETDDSAMDMVADATTEVIRFWDDQGEHRLAVYALGIQDSPSDRDAAFLELIGTIDGFLVEADAEPYEPDRVRVIAGPDTTDPEFEDVRPWPLEDTDLSAWTELANGWQCEVFDGSVLAGFADATQATTWESPDGTGEPIQLLVRGLHPGEPGCPS